MGGVEFVDAVVGQTVLERCGSINRRGQYTQLPIQLELQSL